MAGDYSYLLKFIFTLHFAFAFMHTHVCMNVWARLQDEGSLPSKVSGCDRYNRSPAFGGRVKGCQGIQGGSHVVYRSPYWVSLSPSLALSMYIIYIYIYICLYVYNFYTYIYICMHVCIHRYIHTHKCV